MDEIEKSFIKSNGGVALVNNGLFYARFKVAYFIDENKMTSYETEIIPRHSTHAKEFLIPKAGRDATLKIEVLFFGFGCNSPINIWKLVHKEKIQVPYFKIFTLTGTTIFPKVSEIKLRNHQW